MQQQPQLLPPPLLCSLQSAVCNRDVPKHRFVSSFGRALSPLVAACMASRQCTQPQTPSGEFGEMQEFEATVADFGESSWHKSQKPIKGVTGVAVLPPQAQIDGKVEILNADDLVSIVIFMHARHIVVCASLVQNDVCGSTLLLLPATPRVSFRRWQ
eukprot:SAG11_NODE_9504_length_906_cov_1.018587_1_plen_157_part_00